jgi:hypothetical protein
MEQQHESRESEQPTGRQWCRRAAGTLAVTGAVMGALGMGTASAEPTDAVGVIVDHIEEYHLQQPTWEVETLLTDPEENFAVHKMMLEHAVGAITG